MRRLSFGGIFDVIIYEFLIPSIFVPTNVLEDLVYSTYPNGYISKFLQRLISDT